MSNEFESAPIFASISEMARMVGLSRQRFHQLIGTTFPEPIRDPETNRPYYSQELQDICLEVRRTNFGVDNKPVLFYARRNDSEKRPPRAKSSKTKHVAKYSELMAGLKSLGLNNPIAQTVDEAVRAEFPDGTNGVDFGGVVRAVFLHLKRKEHK